MADSTVSRLKRAVHRNPRTSREGLLERLFTLWFRGLVYTQIWEDPRVDAEALQIDASSRILTISSAGCNVLNYLTHEPAKIAAVDVNRAHMALTRLKLAALRHLPDHDAFFQFFGRGEGAANVRRYDDHVARWLDDSTRSFWETRTWGGLGDRRIQFFADGLYDRGILPRFQRLAASVSQLVQGRRPEELLEAETRAQQEQFFTDCVAPFFDHPLVRRIAEQPATVYSLGIPPNQQRILAEEADAETGASVADLYRERLRKLVCGFPLSDNYFAWQAFGRRYDCENREAIPPYLAAENFAPLRYHAGRVETHVTSLVDFLHDQPDHSFDSFVLLDAMDWMDADAITALWSEIARVGEPGSHVIFRTAGSESVVEPALPRDLRARFTYHRDRSEALHARDRSAIYGMFHLYSLGG
jgi:S-adenosylmethionine-diacylglycerol 3-amino-3-carboxypropyl transferase